MNRIRLSLPFALASSALALLLVACSGGRKAEARKPAPPPPATTPKNTINRIPATRSTPHQAAGIWRGTFTPRRSAGGPQATGVIITPNGTFHLLTANGFHVTGELGTGAGHADAVPGSSFRGGKTRVPAKIELSHVRPGAEVAGTIELKGRILGLRLDQFDQSYLSAPAITDLVGDYACAANANSLGKPLQVKLTDRGGGRILSLAGGATGGPTLEGTLTGDPSHNLFKVQLTQDALQAGGRLFAGHAVLTVAPGDAAPTLIVISQSPTGCFFAKLTRATAPPPQAAAPGAAPAFTQLTAPRDTHRAPDVQMRSTAPAQGGGNAANGPIADTSPAGEGFWRIPTDTPNRSGFALVHRSGTLLASMGEGFLTVSPAGDGTTSFLLLPRREGDPIERGTATVLEPRPGRSFALKLVVNGAEPRTIRFEAIDQGSLARPQTPGAFPATLWAANRQTDATIVLNTRPEPPDHLDLRLRVAVGANKRELTGRAAIEPGVRVQAVVLGTTGADGEPGSPFLFTAMPPEAGQDQAFLVMGLTGLQGVVYKMITPEPPPPVQVP